MSTLVEKKSVEPKTIAIYDLQYHYNNEHDRVRTLIITRTYGLVQSQLFISKQTSLLGILEICKEKYRPSTPL